MLPRISLALALLGGLVVWPSTGACRFIESWPYDKMHRAADLVVLASTVKSEPADDKVANQPWSYEFVGQNTTFTVKQAMKGKVEGPTIRVLHFRFGELKKGLDPNDTFNRVVRDGPMFVTFRLAVPPAEVDRKRPFVPPPDYLLFLKAAGDGRYEPVSGRIDPQLAVREVRWPAGTQ